MEEISTAQFEAIVTYRVLLSLASLSALRNGFKRNTLMSRSCYVGSEVLQDFGLGDVCVCQMRWPKVYLFHKGNHRVIAELAIDCEVDTRTRLCKRPRFCLINRRGFIKAQPLSTLIEEAGKLSIYDKQRRKNGYNNH